MFGTAAMNTEYINAAESNILDRYLIFHGSKPLPLHPIEGSCTSIEFVKREEEFLAKVER